METQELLIVIPTLQEGSWPNPWLLTMIEAAHAAGDPRLRFHVAAVHNAKPHEVARNQAARMMLAGSYTHLLMIDADVKPDFFGKTVRLWELALEGLDIVSAPVPIYHQRVLGYNMWRRFDTGALTGGEGRCVEGHEFPQFRSMLPEELQEAKGASKLVEVDAVGFGAVCLSRYAVRELSDVREGEPFRKIYGPGGKVIASEDFEFCVLAKQCGLKIHTAIEYTCGHLKTVDLLDFVLTRDEAAEAAKLSGAREEAGRQRRSQANQKPTGAGQQPREH